MTFRKLRVAVRASVHVVIISALLIATIGVVPAFATSTPQLLKDIVPGEVGSGPDNYTNVNGTVYFYAGSGEEGDPVGLWKTDGTSAGTVLVKDFGESGGQWRPESLIDVNGTLFFAIQAGPDFGLWKSDGTTAGTVRVKAVESVEPVVMNGTLYFTGVVPNEENTFGRVLWKSDGTEEGTAQVGASRNAANLQVVGSTLYFAGYDDVHGEELWKSDGTTGGTTMVKDLWPGSDGGGARSLASVGNTLFFTASDGTVINNGLVSALWKTDGTAAGTVKLQQGGFNSLINGTDTLYFSGTGENGQTGIWKSDGTTAGTVLVKNLQVSGSRSTTLGNSLLFVASDTNTPGTSGLWKSDGTTAGTTFMKDLHDLSASVIIGNQAYFVANNGLNGREMWKTDASAAGTVLVADLAPSTVGPSIPYVTLLNGTFLFTASDETHGAELWKLDPTPPTVSDLTWTANPLLQGQTTTLGVTATDNSAIQKVEYSLDGGVRQSMTFNTSTETWQAAFGASLAVNTYNVEVIATDTAGNESTPVQDVLAVYNAANGYVTGHSKLLPGGTDTMPIARDTSNNPAKLILGLTNIKAATSTTPTSGSFDMQYVVRNNKDEFGISSTSVDWLVVPDSSHASILGKATLTTYINGVTAVHSNVTVRFDVTLGSPDHIVVKIYDTGVNPATSAPTWQIEQNAQQSQLMIKP